MTAVPGRDAGDPSPRFPVLRWAALAWVLVYVPAYAQWYGAWHFLFLCNLGVLLTVVGIWLDQPLLLSSQAVAAPGIAALWIVDAGTRALTGHHLHGGTSYMWDAAIPPLVRALSLYHVAWPVLLAWCLRRQGYDRRGFALQVAIVALVLALGLTLVPATENLNYVIRMPGAPVPAAHPWLRAGGGFAVLVLALYLPVHGLLRRVFPAPAGRATGL